MMLRARAPAKVNLTLHVLGRRADGYHELESIVAFAGCAADVLTLAPSRRLGLALVDGPFARAAGPDDDNLVIRAAIAAAERIEGIALGMFFLTKRIPVAAGLGGGSADAAAALRLIAQANDIAPDDPRLVEAAAATGSDVPACLVSRACLMTGRGEGVTPLNTPAIAAVLANPLKPTPTPAIFRALGLQPGEGVAAPFTSPRRGEVARRSRAGEGALGPESLASPHPALRADLSPPGRGEEPRQNSFIAELAAGRNDLQPPAVALVPEIAVGLDALAASEGCALARMSGSGATVFGLFSDQRAARRAARALRQALPGWWVMPTLLR